MASTADAWHRAVKTAISYRHKVKSELFNSGSPCRLYESWLYCQHHAHYISYNSENECLFGCKLCRTTCSVREDKLCPPSLSKSSFARIATRPSGYTKGFLGPGSRGRALVRRSGDRVGMAPLKLKAIHHCLLIAKLQHIFVSGPCNHL